MVRESGEAPGGDLSTVLGQGVYTVPETCRILRPSMTPRKVHYWLDTELLGEPLRHGRRGVPTLLRFEQVLKIRTLQRLRDDLGFSLQHVRRDLAKLLEEITSAEWHEFRFVRTGGGEIGVADADGIIVAIPSKQGVMEDVLEELTLFLAATQGEWRERRLSIDGFPHLVSDAAVIAGSPVIVGTRIETAFIANLSTDLSLPEIMALFPDVDETAVEEAIEFEGAEPLAA